MSFDLQIWSPQAVDLSRDLLEPNVWRLTGTSRVREGRHWQIVVGVVFPLPLSPTIGQQSGAAVASWLSKHAWIRAIAVLNNGYLTSRRSGRSIDSVTVVIGAIHHFL